MYVVTVKSTVEISQNFVAFSEYINFTWLVNVFVYYSKMFNIFLFFIYFRPLDNVTMHKSSAAVVKLWINSNSSKLGQ